MIKIQPSLFMNFTFLKISLYYQIPRRCSKQGSNSLKLRMWTSYVSQSTRRTILLFRNCILINMVPRFHISGERIWFFKLFRALHFFAPHCRINYTMTLLSCPITHSFAMFPSADSQYKLHGSLGGFKFLLEQTDSKWFLEWRIIHVYLGNIYGEYDLWV